MLKGSRSSRQVDAATYSEEEVDGFSDLVCGGDVGYDGFDGFGR